MLESGIIREGEETELWIHLADRSIATMEKVCRMRNCPICEKWWKLGVDLYS